MNDFIAARSQMALSLGFHIIYSCIGMVMPVFMAVSHYKYLKTQDEVYKNITQAWSKGVAIFFATGAVSGTMLSFELGLLWPGFMKHAGPIFGMPFSLEGVAFFIETIALGFFLYGWKRFNKWFHWYTGVLVGVSGIISGILVVAANAWMNSPAGFDYVNGQYLNIDPIKAMFNDAWFSEALHMTIAAFSATGFAVAGVHALMIYRRQNITFHTKAFKIAIAFAAVAALLQPLSGDISAKSVAKRQPAKLAAMEALFKTQTHAPLLVGGIPNSVTEEVKYGLELPGMLSFLVHDNFNGEVKGLDAIPKNERPPVAITHYAFQIMVGLGIIAGSAISGQIDTTATNFMDAYVYGWFNLFSIDVGLFTVALCGFLAAIYLIGESTEDIDVKRFILKAKVLNILAFIFGGLVFLAAEIQNIHLASWIFGNAISLTAVILASIFLVLLWITINKGKRLIARAFASFQVSMILLSVGYRHYPNFIMIKGGNNLSVLTHHATEKTIDTLGMALLIGSLFILPSLFYLYYSFKDRNREDH